MKTLLRRLKRVEKFLDDSWDGLAQGEHYTALVQIRLAISELKESKG